MRILTAAALVLFGAACSRTLEAPAPVVVLATNPLDPDVHPAVVCNAQGDLTNGWSVEVLGDHFVALPRGVLTDKPQVDIPIVSLTDGGGARTTLPRTRTFFTDHQRLRVDLPTAHTAVGAMELTPGGYGLTVENPGNAATTLAGAVTMVPPPRIASVAVFDAAGTTPSASVCANETQRLVITGSNFRTDRPLVVTIGGKALPAPTSVSSTQVVVTLPANTFSSAEANGALFTIQVRSSEGCIAPYGTDPRGAGVTEVRVQPSCLRLGTLAVSPRFGWDQQNQPVTITNLYSQPTTQPFSGGAPAVSILAPLKGPDATVQKIALRRVAFVDANTITAVVPTCSGKAAALSNSDCSAGLLPGGPYDIELVDPSGATGTLPKAFSVVANQPPAFAGGASAISPASVNGAANVRITGSHFDVGAQHATVWLGTPVANGVQFCPMATAAGGTTNDTTLDVAVPASFTDLTKCYVETATGTQVAATAGFTVAPNLYLVRVQHTGDVAFADYSGLIVTASSYNPVEKGVAASTLNTARSNQGVVVGTDDFGNAFLYAVGGSSNGANELDSVEVAPIGPFGDLGGTCTGGACKFRVLDRTPLPAARAGLSLVARTIAGDTTYLFAIGGRSGNTASTDVRRAQVLRNADAPVVTASSGAAGTLAAGTYYYRVSGVRPTSDVKNPGGETLASDTQPHTLSAAGGVTITWSCGTAVKYRIYRTASANAASGTEVLLDEKSATSSCTGSETYTDNGSKAVGTEKPLPNGALGKWAGSGDGVPQLNAARFDAAAKIVGSSIYVVGGCSAGAVASGVVACTGGNELADLEKATFAAAGDVTPAAFAQTTGALTNKRSRHALTVADPTTVKDVPAGKAYLVAVGGRQGNADISGNTKTVEVLDTAGTTFSQPNSMPTNVGSGGWAEVIANLFFFEMDDGGTLNAKSASPADICTGSNCNLATNIDFKANAGFPTYTTGGTRYLAGEQLFRAFIYVVGGFASSTPSSNTYTATNTVERIVY